jgi:hypothetical protein
VSPHIDILPENLALTPDRAILTLPLKEGEKYSFTIKDIEDIYGRKASLEYSTTLKSEPFLSLKLSQNKQIYTKNEPIAAKLYTLLPAKKSYTLKLCRLNLEGYARVERTLSDPSLINNQSFRSLLSSQEVSECREKEIVLKEGGYVSPFTISDFFLSDAKKTGLYMLHLPKMKIRKGSKNLSHRFFFL